MATIDKDKKMNLKASTLGAAQAQLAKSGGFGVKARDEPDDTRATGIEDEAGFLPYVQMYHPTADNPGALLRMESICKEQAGKERAELGDAFLMSGNESRYLHPGKSIWFALDMFTCFGVIKNKGEVIETRAEKFEHDPAVHGDTKPGLAGRAIVLILFDGSGPFDKSDGTPPTPTACVATLRTTPGRKGGMVGLDRARGNCVDQLWLEQHPKHAKDIADDLSVLRCGIRPSFPPADFGGNKWTGFDGRTDAFPEDDGCWDVVIAVLNSYVESGQQAQFEEWRAAEVANLKSKWVD